MLQPLHIILNRPFTTHMRYLWIHWKADCKAEQTAKGNFKRPFLRTVVSWIKTAWNMISQEMVQKFLLKCWISNKLDDPEDDGVWQEDSNETENEESGEAAES